MREGLTVRKNLEDLIHAKGGALPSDPVATFAITDTDTESLEELGYSFSVPKLMESMGNEDCFSLVEIGTYGAKGQCRYGIHVIYLSHRSHYIYPLSFTIQVFVPTRRIVISLV